MRYMFIICLCIIFASANSQESKPYSYEILEEIADSLFDNCFYEEAIEYYKKIDVYSADTISYAKTRIAVCMAALNYHKDSVFYYLSAALHISCKVSIFDFLDFRLDPYQKHSEWDIIFRNFLECRYAQKNKIFADYCLMFATDQKFRGLHHCKFSKYSKEEKDSMGLIQQEIDYQNSLYLYENLINKKYGIPSNITEKCAYVGFIMVLLHSPLYVQKAYKKEINKAFKIGQISNYDYAFFHDKLRVKQGKRQLYGTQHIYNETTQKMEVAPIKRQSKLKKRLQSIGIQD